MERNDWQEPQTYEQILLEEREKLLLEEKAASRKAAGRSFLTALITVVVLGALIFAAVTAGIPWLRNARAFAQAEQLLEQGLYDEASAAFQALEGVKDADRMALEALYQKALSLRDQGRYAAAIQEFQALGDYQDSRQQAEDTLYQWKEADYQAARALVDAGAYPAAAAAFEALGDYKDSADWVFECRMLQREHDYADASAAMAAGDYAAAQASFEALGEYRDSAELARECHALRQAQDYAAACEALEAGDYAAAIGLFDTLEGYSDTADKLVEAHYGNGLKLLQEEDFAGAIRELELCGGYQHTDWNLKQAKMGYARTHADPADPKTLEYLKELKSVYFQGASALYEQIFGWKVEIVAFSNSEQANDQETLSKYGTMYVHFRVTGGEPGQSTTIRTVLTVPGGNRGTIYHNGCTDGYEGYTSFWFDYPSQAPTGTLTFQAYDEAGKLLCTGSVQIVS